MKTPVVLMTVALAGALIAHFAFDLPLGFALLLFFVGWPLVGTLITLDEDLPGGWSNPDGTVRPPWLETPFWGQISGGLAASAAGFAVDFGWRSGEGQAACLAGVAAGFLAAALFTRKWWLLVGAVVGITALWHGAARTGLPPNGAPQDQQLARRSR